MDEQSKLVLFKLINANILEEVNGIISTGKESNVYHGIGANFEKKIDTGEVQTFHKIKNESASKLSLSLSLSSN